MIRREILPNFENCTEAELERVMNAVPERREFRRLFAILMILRGLKPADLAATLGIDRQTLRAWIKRFNAEGIDGLLDRPRCGRPCKISSELDAHLQSLIEAPGEAGQTHWTARNSTATCATS